jgi:hypothetical protein
MPAPVQVWLDDRNFARVEEKQLAILDTYTQDFSKHAPSSLVPKLRYLWNSIPSQLAKENKKFIYGLVTLYLEGTFYIGWEQNTDLMMNVGYDANTSRQKKLFYNISSVWYESEFKGSLMMRPVFNADPLVTSISEKPTNKTLQVAPNPSNGSLHIINQSEFTFGTVTIFNYLGKKVFEKQMNTSETLDVSHLINGMYIITFAPENDTPVSTRLILTK